MSWSVLLSMLATSAGTGLTCGVSCGACGTPVVNVFLSSYLFTHSGKLRRSLLSFAGFHLGKMITVALLCVLISLLGDQIVDETGNMFGVNLQMLVYAAMLVFMLVLIKKWFRDHSAASEPNTCTNCGGGCCSGKTSKSVETDGGAGSNDRGGINKGRTRDGFLPMLVYGCISGLSPCTSLVIVLGYASVLTMAEAAIVGLCFSFANSIVPFLLLVLLTGLLSREMYRELPDKIKYFQLVTYVVFATAIVYNMVTSL